MEDAKGMKELAGKISSKGTLRLPGDKTWEYVVQDGQWMTRKVGTDRFIPIASLKLQDMMAAESKLDAAFPSERGIGKPEVEAEAMEFPLPKGMKMPEFPTPEVFSIVEDKDDPFEYMVLDGKWVTRKKGQDKILTLDSLPADKQLAAIQKLDMNFPDVRTDEQKADTYSKLAEVALELPDANPMAERLADLSRSVMGD
jgi:hypothetical protein